MSNRHPILFSSGYDCQLGRAIVTFSVLLAIRFGWSCQWERGNENNTHKHIDYLFTIYLYVFHGIVDFQIECVYEGIRTKWMDRFNSAWIWHMSNNRNGIRSSSCLPSPSRTDTVLLMCILPIHMLHFCTLYISNWKLRSNEKKIPTGIHGTENSDRERRRKVTQLCSAQFDCIQFLQGILAIHSPLFYAFSHSFAL